MTLENVETQTLPQSQGKKKGNYNIDMNKTPLENIVDFCKLVLPVETALSKISNNDNFYIDRGRGITVNNIRITGERLEKSYSYDVSKIEHLERIKLEIDVPGAYSKHRRGGTKMGTVKVNTVKKTISITWFLKIYNQLDEIYKNENSILQKRQAEQKAEQLKLKEIREKSSLPGGVSLGKYGDTYTLNINYLSEDKVIKIGNAIKGII